MSSLLSCAAKKFPHHKDFRLNNKKSIFHVKNYTIKEYPSRFFNGRMILHICIKRRQSITQLTNKTKNATYLKDSSENIFFNTTESYIYFIEKMVTIIVVSIAVTVFIWITFEKVSVLYVVLFT